MRLAESNLERIQNRNRIISKCQLNPLNIPVFQKKHVNNCRNSIYYISTYKIFTALTQYSTNNVSLNLLLIKTLSYNNVQLIFIQNHTLTKVLTFLLFNVTL